MLIGQYESHVDEKNRIALPKAFRTILGDKLVITLGYENSLIIVQERQWSSLLEGTEGRPFIEYETRETQRFLLGGASIVELDSKGRFVLPEYLRAFAGIKAEATFLGLSRYIELWDKETWVEYQAKLASNIEKISERLVNKESGSKTKEKGKKNG